jgi:hypothetical protein
MQYIFRRIISMVLFLIPMGIIMGILGEFVLPWLNRTGIVHLSLYGRKGENTLILISLVVYVLLLVAFYMYRANRKSTPPKYDISNWSPSGTDIWQIMSERSPQSTAFLQNMVGYEIKRLYGTPKQAEVEVDTMAFMGIAHECPHKSNSDMMGLITAVSNTGRNVFERGGNVEMIGAPSYFKMIEDYYRHYGLDAKQVSWMAITNPEPPIKDWNLEGQPLWYIAARCVEVVDKA